MALPASRIAAFTALVVTLLVGQSGPAAAQTAGTPERYSATAINMGSGPALAGTVQLAVTRWTSVEERQRLLTIFVEKGPKELLDALQDTPSTGRINRPGTVAYDLRYAFQSPLPDGGRRVVLITDRPIPFAELVNQPRTVDYPFTLVEIRFDAAGVGVGKMSVATKISLSRDKQTIELENFGIEPVRLTEVRVER